MKNIFLLCLLFTEGVYSQPVSLEKQINKSDKKIIERIKKTILYLSDDKLEGRRSGTPGEKLAYEFIENSFKKTGLEPLGNNQTFIQEFEINDGREIGSATTLLINDRTAVLNNDFFPLAFSANASRLKLAFNDDQKILQYDLKNMLQENENNPHFDLKENIYNAAKKAGLEGREAFIIYNSSMRKDDLMFDPKDKSERLSIPVVYLSKNIFNREKSPGSINLSLEVREKKRTGHNVIGFINNNAKNTIVIGAHYDHLGYGEDHNSLYSGTTPMIHNGADDNSSGTAAVIELSDLLKKSSLKKNNYLFAAFSGEELGLYGSKYFTEHCPIDLSSINYMINLDMVGRLNDSTRRLNVGGYGTSPSWNQLIDTGNTSFKLNLDSSGTGPSDHTSFYRKNIPVLFFFTGAHKDYHKPTDDADKINYAGELAIIKFIYNTIALSDAKDKLVFTATRESASMGKSSFKVTLGIMPDYTFSGNGVRVDGISEGKAAQKAGLMPGDVLYRLGDHSFSDVQSYMQALNKFNKGEVTKVKVRRGNTDMEFDVVF